jgi:DNA repair protein RecN (Recombination protein N)
LASIAAKGNNNLFISKNTENNRTVTKIQKLNEGEIINEIARITSGGNITETAIAHAKELRG